MNKVILLARMVNNPDYRNTSEDKRICRLRVAEGKEYPVFINVLTVGNLADQCNQWLQKGSQILIEGRLRQEEYQGKTSYYIFAEKIQFLHKLKEQSNA